MSAGPGKAASPSGTPGAGLALREEEAAQALSAIAMRCGGCGAKVGAPVLSRARADLRLRGCVGRRRRPR